MTGTDRLIDRPESAEVVESVRSFEGAVWDVRRDRFRFGGQELAREYLDHPGAAAVLAVDDDERVLLINQYRHPIRSRDWELPAGLLDVEGEGPLATAQRELAEEADLVASEWSELFTLHPSPGGSSEVIHVFEARGLADSPEPFARTAEEAELELRWVPLAEVVAAVLAGRVRNGILMTAVLAAHARRT